jgi:hypothetical protein
MTGLVDSLMGKITQELIGSFAMLINAENFYIPPIILNKKTPPEPGAKELLVCVDGKQRLSSVLAFVKGLIPCHDHLGEKWWFRETASARRKRILPAEVQRQFLNKDLVAFEFDHLSPEQEEDLFARVQMGIQLNLAEKMRASTGPWQELARLFVEDFPDVFTLMKDRSRSKDFQLTLACFSQILEVMHPNTANGIPTLKTSHTALPKLLKNKNAVDDSLKSHLASIWHTFQDLIALDPAIFTNENKYLRGVQTFAPVEMVAITVLISMYSETRNNRLLLGDISALRVALRENFVDLRLNSIVWKFIWEYLDELEAIRGAVEGTAVDRMRDAPQTTGQGPFATRTAPSPVSAMKAIAGKKRGRPSKANHSPDAPSTIKQEGQATSPPASSSKKQRKTPKAGSTPMVNEQDATNSASGFPQLPPFPVRIISQSPAPSQDIPNSSVQVPGLASTVPTPLEARQNRISKLDSYRAPPAPMGRPPNRQDINRAPFSAHPQSLNLTQQISGPESLFPLSKPSVDLSNESEDMKFELGATKTDEPRETRVTIDLTSDDEQERQSLLSSFKMRGMANGTS